MPTVRPTAAFQQHVGQQFGPEERASISSLVQDLDDYGIPMRDPDLFVQKDIAIASQQVPALKVNFYILPAKISTGIFRARTMWFGMCEIVNGPQLLNNWILVLTVWTSDRRNYLNEASHELQQLALGEFP